jgi:hypothetical protein
MILGTVMVYFSYQQDGKDGKIDGKAKTETYWDYSGWKPQMGSAAWHEKTGRV